MWVGVATAAALVTVAALVPRVADWSVYVPVPPLNSTWEPRVGAGTLPAVAIATATLLHAQRLCRTLSWGRLLAVSWAAGLAWMLALALVDGIDGIAEVLQTPNEYLGTARSTTDLGATLREYSDRIGTGERAWPVHIAGHPPGALTFFVVLVRLGLGSGLAAGLVVTLIAASTAPAVAITVRRLGAEDAARRALPFLTVGPAALWQSVSADAVFAAVGAWGLAALACASATSGARDRLGSHQAARLGWAVVAGLLLGFAVMMSYGLVLLGAIALAVLAAARSWRALWPCAAAALLVVLAYWAAGFAWWDGLHALRGRYWDGVASDRPGAYWTWANLAAFVCSAGPVAGAVTGLVVAHLARLARRAPVGLRHRPTARAESVSPAPAAPTERALVLTLAAGALVAVLAADLSQLSRAEVERIWLPFAPWLLVGTALLPPRAARALLVAQVLTALVLQHLLHTLW